MATIRCQLFFQTAANGWSETYFLSGTNTVSSLNTVKALTLRRMALSSFDTVCTYQRISDDAVFRDSLVTSSPFPGTYSPTLLSAPDFTALLVRLSSGVQFRRSLFMRGIPEALVQGQDFVPDATWISRFNSFATYLENNFSLKVFDRALNPVIQGLFITAAGVCQTLTNTAFPVGSIVRFRKVGTVPRLTGNQIVTVPSAGFTFTILNYGNRGAWNLPYLVQQATIDLQPIDNVVFERLVSRRVGRPFGQSRGRRKVIR